MTDFKTVVRVLAEGAVDFIVVGGLAGVMRGAARLTFDVDVVYRRSAENIRRLALALTPYHPSLRGAPRGLPFRWDVATIERGRTARHARAETLPDDCLGAVSTDSMAHARPRP